MPFDLPIPSVRLSDHACDSGYMRLVTCFHTEGMYHGSNLVNCCYYHLGVPQNLNVQFCKCRSNALTLIELGYWPGTPSHPFIAFSFPFMDWMEALLLECQVSVQDFTNAVETFLKENIVQVSSFC